MDNKEMLGQERVGKLLFKLAFPQILAQLINVLYNVVDRLYIAGLHHTATMSALTTCLPILMIVSAFSALVGMSGAPLASIEMGKGNKEKAERIMNNSFMMLIVISILLTTLVEIFQEGILTLFGATESSMPYAKQYLTIYMAGTIAVEMALGLNNFIGTQGFSKTSMASVLIGAITNIILDPIFIFALDMKIQGAALATIISQTISAIWVLSFLCGKKTMLKLKWRLMKPDLKIILPILALGVSPFIMQSTESLVQMTFNNGFRKYSASTEEANTAIAGMGILFTVMQVTTMPLVGLAQGGQPIISFNYGARNMDRVKSTYKLLVICSSIFIGTLWTLIMAFPGIFAKPLSTEPAVFEFAKNGLRIFMAGAILFFMQFSCQQSLVALGQAKVSLFLALFRKVFMLIPLAIVLPMMMEDKTLGLLIAEPISDAVAATVTSIVFFFVFRKLNKKVEESIIKDKLDEEKQDERNIKDSKIEAEENTSEPSEENASTEEVSAGNSIETAENIAEPSEENASTEETSEGSDIETAENTAEPSEDNASTEETSEGSDK